MRSAGAERFFERLGRDQALADGVKLVDRGGGWSFVTHPSPKRELDEDTTLDLDLHGRICAITIEHASARGGPELTYEQVGARA